MITRQAFGVIAKGIAAQQQHMPSYALQRCINDWCRLLAETNPAFAEGRFREAIARHQRERQA